MTFRMKQTIDNEQIIYDHLYSVNGNLVEIVYDDSIMNKTFLERLFVEGQQAAKSLKNMFKFSS